jgi:2,3-bisphosphoglycerate-dependent phosphoglycerate mutase
MQRDKGPREVWFIRHGESVANAGGRTTEAGIYPLTERGFRQASQLAAALPLEPDFIIHSPYLRARQTAEPTMGRFASVPNEEWSVQEVQYLDPALCVNTTQDERHVLAFDYWEKCDPYTAAPNAESFVDFVLRARTALDRLAARTERLTYVFCHGHFMRALAWLLLFRPSELTRAAMLHFRQFMQSYLVRNCAVQTVYFHENGATSLGGLWVPDGVEHEPIQATLRGQEGI